MAPPEKVGLVTYRNLIDLCGVTRNQVHHDVSRGNLDLDDVQSIVMWVARRCGPDLKKDIIVACTSTETSTLAVSPKLKRQQKKAKARRAKK